MEGFNKTVHVFLYNEYQNFIRDCGNVEEYMANLKSLINAFGKCDILYFFKKSLFFFPFKTIMIIFVKNQFKEVPVVAQQK